MTPRQAESNAEPTIFIVDDDAAVRDSLSLMLGLHGYRTAVFSNGEAFLAARRPEWRGCALLDIKMENMNGLDLQQHLRKEGVTLPVIIVTGHADVAAARTALKANAVDFLEKPLDDKQLISAIEQALARDRSSRDEAAQRGDAAARIAALSQREREVMHLICTGLHNRDVGEQLGISPRTVEVYRARMMEKLQVHNLAELIHLSIQAQAEPPATH